MGPPLARLQVLHATLKRMGAELKRLGATVGGEEAMYHGETLYMLTARWKKLERDLVTKKKTWDISKIPDIYVCIKYDLLQT